MTQLKLQLVLLVALTPIDAGRRVEIDQPFATTSAQAEKLQSIGAARTANEEEVKQFVVHAVDVGKDALPTDLAGYVQAFIDAQYDQAAADAKASADALAASEKSPVAPGLAATAPAADASAAPAAPAADTSAAPVPAADASAAAKPVNANGKKA